MNDEANLIYVSKLANQGKSNQAKFLKDLHEQYKKKIFNTKDDKEIKEFIYKQLEGKNAEVESVKQGDHFIFGRYLSFINLDQDQRKAKAFRHALFLDDTDPLKQKVINALQNRNRAIVNGTQRYLAQCIADKLYKKAKHINREKQIKFDYFEYSANSVHDLRKYYKDKEATLADGKLKLKDIEKKEDQKQEPRSHLIDAQMAFLLATDDHKNDGSMGLYFNKLETLKQGDINTKTGEFNPTKFFDLSRVSKDQFSQKNLSRRKSATGIRLHRPFHLPNFYAENYMPLFFSNQGNEIKIKAGFSWKNSVSVSNKNEKDILNILEFAKNEDIAKNKNKNIKELYDNLHTKTKCGNTETFYIDWNKNKIQKYLVDKFSNQDIANGKCWSDEVKFLRELGYRIRKQPIKNPEDIENVLKGITIGTKKKKDYFSIKLFNERVDLPVKFEWENLAKEWAQCDREFDDFLKDYFCKKSKKEDTNIHVNNHKKVRKSFSLPVADTGGHFLQKRKSWDGKEVYQISGDSDSRKDGNKFSRFVLMNNKKLEEIINKPFKSRNTFKLVEFSSIENSGNSRNIDPNVWIEIENNNDFPNNVERIEYRIDNITRPQVKIYLSNQIETNDIDRDYLIEAIHENPLTKAKDKENLSSKLEGGNNIIEYTASGFNQKIKNKLLKALTNA